KVSGLVETPIDDERIVRAFGVAVRIEDAALAADLDTGLAILRDNGRFGQLYDRLMAKYQPREAPEQVSRTAVVWAGGVVGALVLVLLGMYAVSQRRLARRTRLMLAQESQLAAVTQAVPALVYSYFVGDDGRRERRFANRQLEEWRQRYPRLDPGLYYKGTIAEDIHPEDRPMYDEASVRAGANKTPFDVVFRLKDSTGQYRWIHSALTAFAEPGGTLWQGLIQDLSQSYRAAQELRESRERYARIFEGCHDAIVVFRAQGEQILEVNERACELYGYTRAEMLSMSLRAVSVDVKAGEQLVGRSEKTGWYESFDWRQRRKDGTIIDVHVSGHVVEFDGQPAILSLTRDVTERKRERQAAERERRVFLGGPTVVCRWVNAPGYPIEHVSANVAQFGYTVEELVSGQVANESLVHPEDLERVIGEIARAERAFEASIETDYRIRTREGESRWVHGYIALVRDAAGVTTHLEGCVTDQTNLRRAEAERRELERQLWQSQRLESLGVLVGGVAHDFNNLLVGILANAHLVGRTLAPLSEEGRAAALIVTAAGRAADLTRQMLAYAGGQPIAPRPVDLSRVVVECAALASRMAPAGALVEVIPSARALVADADEVQMSQVVLNLISNAVEACGAGREGMGAGRVTIAAYATEITRTELNHMVLGPQAVPGRFVCLEVTDDGVGMNDETRARIFDPFYTTKATGHGLGLAAVLGIVRAHRGAIGVESAEGRGTKIRVMIPMSATTIAAVEIKPERVEAGAHRILVVDDETLVRETVELSLRSVGCETFAFASGAEAIEAVRSGLAVDAAFVDRRMPGMSGEQTMAGLREVVPGLAIIIASGLADQRVVEGLTRLERVVFLSKPFSPTDLTDCLARLFAEGACAPGGIMLP
ncbi:MAG: PAS domain S-box protein, partial [Planctomycetota bacterium]